ncbi:MAG TPA: alpha/beta hydrolase [Ramlibacter sp.]|jgi:esterase/lipase superfamily enzyme|nr:alpha/beta hydrolase [Ramlibacter sp.]
MLIFTNRELDTARTDIGAFGRAFRPLDSRIAAADVDGNRLVSGHDVSVDQDEAHALLVPKFRGNKPVVVYIHGFNNEPITCLRRCEKLAAMYDVEVVAFAWPAEGLLSDGGHVPETGDVVMGEDEDSLAAVRPATKKSSGIKGLMRRFRQAKFNAEDSVEALGAFLRVVAAARLRADAQPFTLVAHSLGAHLLHHALRQVTGVREAAAVASNVALLAPCVRAAGHDEWVQLLRPTRRTYITFAQADHVLEGARWADGDVKLGVNPGKKLLAAPAFRYVCFTGTNAGAGAHRYFIESTDGRDQTLFRRIFRSEADIRPDEAETKVYQAGSSHDGSVFYMGFIPTPDAGGGN